MKKILLIVTLCGLTAAAGSEAFAIGCSVPVDMSDVLSVDACLDYTLASDGVTKLPASVAGFAWVKNNPSFNTGTEDIVCEAAGVGGCATGGDATDGQTSVSTNWANGGINGCPVSGTTASRVIIVVQGADGSGFLASLAGTSSSGYDVTLAHKVDLVAGVIVPLTCGSGAGKPVYKSLIGNLLSLTFSRSVVYSDCDPDAYGALVPDLDCSTFTPPATAYGKVYTSDQACGTKPDLRLSLWTAALGPTGSPAVIDAATGDVTIQVPTVTSGHCAFVGATTTVDGLESSGLTGFLQVPGQTAASPVAEHVTATKANGKLKVSWTTSSELNLVGFRVLAIGNKGEFQLGTTVQSTGVAGGGSSYSQTYGLGDLKGAKGIVVESLLSDRSTLRSSKVVISN